MKIDGRVKSHYSSKVDQCTSKRVEYDDKPVATNMLRNNHKTKEDMASLGKPIADENSAAIAKLENHNIDFNITTCRNLTANEKLASGLRDGCEAEVDTTSLIQDTADENPAASVKFKHGHEVQVCTSFSEPIQECSSILLCSASMKRASLAKEMDVLHTRFGTASGSGISVCLPEDDGQVVRDISVDEGDPTEDKLPLCSDYNISIEKSSNVMPSITSESHSHRVNLEMISDQLKVVTVEDKPGIKLRSKDCNPEEQGVSCLYAKGIAEDELPFSEVRTTENDKGMLEEHFILNFSNVKDKLVPTFHDGNKIVEWPGTGNVLVECGSESFTLSSKQINDVPEFLARKGEEHGGNMFHSSNSSSIDCLDVRLEPPKERKALSVSNFVDTTMAVPDGFPLSRADRPNEVESSACGAGTNNTSVICNVNCIDEFESSLLKGVVMKDRDCSPRYCSLENDINKNVDLNSTNWFRLQTNSLSMSEEDRTLVVVKSSVASRESHSVLSMDMVRDNHVTECLSGEAGGSLKHDKMNAKRSNNLLIDCAVNHQVLAGQTIEAAEHGENSVAESRSEKFGSLISGSTDSSISETGASTNISTPTSCGSEATMTGENQSQRSLEQSVFAGHPVGQAHYLEMGQNVSTEDTAQWLHEAASDVCDNATGNSDAAEMASNTHSGPILLSGTISYPGSVLYSGSVSHRSDSSTASTRSFAFPILSSEWNSSPVRMARADSRFFRKKRCWRFCFFCCRF